MGTLANIAIEPCQVLLDEVDMGFTEGDLEITTEENAADVVAHQEGTQVLEKLRTGMNVGVTLQLKETTVAQLNTLIGKGGATATAAAEVSTVVAIADVGGALDGLFFNLNAALDTTLYYVWFNVDAGGNDPAPAGRTGITVAVTTGDSATVVATAMAAAIDAIADFGATSSGATVTITNAATGGTTDIVDVDSLMVVAVTTQGVSAITGWGKSKNFLGQLVDSKALRLHPVANAATDRTKDLTFWKAYLLMDSITKSGENPQMVSVTFNIFPDSSRADTVNLFVLGESR